MSRKPMIELSRIRVTVHSEPSGAHHLDVEGPADLVGVKYSIGQLPMLKRGIAELEQLASTESPARRIIQITEE